MSDLDRFGELGDRLVPPPLDSLRETARRRDRRTAAAAVAGLRRGRRGRGRRHRTPLRLRRRAHRAAAGRLPRGSSVTTRPLTYADGVTIHYGEQTLDAPGPVQELDVTDDGVAFRTSDGRIWFTDGSRVEELGTLGKPSEPDPEYVRHWIQAHLFSPVLTSAGWVVSGNSGSRVAWFEFPQPGAPEVVVYDTHAREVVIRKQVAVAAGSWAAPHSVDDTSAYLFLDPDAFADDHMPQARLDLATGEQAPVSAKDYLADVGSRPARTLAERQRDHRRGDVELQGPGRPGPATGDGAAGETAATGSRARDSRSTLRPGTSATSSSGWSSGSTTTASCCCPPPTTVTT